MKRLVQNLLVFAASAIFPAASEPLVSPHSLVQLRVISVPELGLGTEQVTTTARGIAAEGLMSVTAGQPCDPTSGASGPGLWPAAGLGELQSCDATGTVDSPNGIVVRATFREMGAVESSIDGSIVVLDLNSVVNGLAQVLFVAAANEQRSAILKSGIALEGEERIMVRIPTGMSLITVAPTTAGKQGPLSFEVSLAAVSSREYQVIVKTTLATEGATRESAQKLVEDLAQGTDPRLSLDLLFFNDAEKLLSEERFQEAMQALKMAPVAERHPALVHIRRSRVLLRAGLIEAAQAEGRLATEKEPDLPLAHAQLAEYLRRGTFGKLAEPGCHLEEAIAALRRVRELAPANRKLWAELPMILRFDTCMRWYGPNAHLEEAAQLFQELAGMRGGEPYRIAQAHTLLRIGRYGDAEQLARSSEGPPVLPVLYAAVAMQRGVDAVRAEAMQQAPDDREKRAADVAGAGVQLMLAAKFQPAARLISMAAEWNPERAAGWLRLAGVLETVVPGSFARDAGTDPLGLFADVQRVLALDAPSSEQLRALISKNSLETEFNPARLREALSSLEYTIQDPSQQSLVDVLMAAVETQLDGDDVSGYVLRYRLKLLPDAAWKRLFVVKENGRYVIRGNEDFLYEALEEIESRLTRDELSLPRLWLHALGTPSVPSADPIQAQLSACATIEPEASRKELLFALTVHHVLLGQTEDANRLRAMATDESEGAKTETCEPLLGLWMALANGDLLQIERRARSLARATPDSELYFRVLVGALSAQDKSNEARVVAEQRLALLPGDPAALLWLNRLARVDGSSAEAKQWLADLARSPHAGPGQRNNAAWDAFIAGDTGDDVLALAQEVVAAKGSSWEAGHTLAAVLASRGKIRAAIDAMHAAIAKQDNRADPDFWLIPALIAEDLGLTDLAVTYYRRILPSQTGIGEENSSYDYAVRRLKQLVPKEPPSEGTKSKP